MMVAQASGAYIFRPDDTTPYVVNEKPDVTVVDVRMHTHDVLFNSLSCPS